MLVLLQLPLEQYVYYQLVSNEEIEYNYFGVTTGNIFLKIRLLVP